ncbi:SEC-C metal-binding domain-containing protein [Burkholderia cenocepacia]
MASVPAICNQCGTPFPSGLEMGNGSHSNTFISFTAGPCPKCGGRGSIPPGVYGVIDGLVQFARAGGSPNERLAMLGEVAVAAKENGWSADQFKDEAERRSPGASKLLSWIPSNKGEWYTFVGLLIMVATLLQASSGYTLKDLIHAGADGISNNASTPVAIASVPHNTTPRHFSEVRRGTGKHKIRRNDVCHCGSGLKYKKCHGR